MAKIKLKKPAKLVLLAVVGVGIFFGAKSYINRPQEVGQSAEVGKVVIPDAPEASLTGTAAVKYEFPSDKPALNGGLKINIKEMAWASQGSLNYANGGERTTKGSLLDKAGFDISIERQDDCLKSTADMVKWINEYKNGSTQDGLFIIFMGSGVPNYLNGIAQAVQALGPEYAPVVFFTSGKSYGEDQIIGDIEYKKNPQLLKGRVLRGVKMDGGIDIALKFAGDNGIPVNANDKLYDANALNLSYGSDYLTVVQDYNNNVSDAPRKIVLNGRTTGKDTIVKAADLVATWTPGDVNAIEKPGARGGATIISTRQYASMMPNMYITCKKFLNNNREKMKDFMVAVYKAGDQIRSFEDVKKRAAEINAKIWNEENGDYWYKLYTGRQSGDAFLGGSMVFNLNDAAKIFGINNAGPDIYREVYTTFGKLQSKLYPEDLPSIVEYSKAVDKSILSDVAANYSSESGSALETEYADKITSTVSSKDVHINFAFGSAEIQKSSIDDLDEIYSAAVTSEGLKVGVFGHTDDIGNDEANKVLSERRAEAVKNYLVKKGLQVNRIESAGRGEEEPIASNSTEGGRAENRRVQIVLGN